MPYTPAQPGRIPRYLPPRETNSLEKLRDKTPEMRVLKRSTSLEYIQASDDVIKLQKKLEPLMSSLNDGDSRTHRSISMAVDDIHAATRSKTEKNTAQALVKMKSARDLLTGIIRRIETVATAPSKKQVKRRESRVKESDEQV